MSSLRIFIHGEPKGQPRPRAFAFNGRARVYDPGTAEGWKGAVAAAWAKSANGIKLDGPLEVGMHFVFRRPKSHYRSNGELKPSAPKWHTNKPDADNLAKAVADALTQLGAWHDDSQISSLDVTKKYTVGGFLGCCLELIELEATEADGEQLPANFSCD